MLTVYRAVVATLRGMNISCVDKLASEDFYHGWWLYIYRAVVARLYQINISMLH